MLKHLHDEQNASPSKPQDSENQNHAYAQKTDPTENYIPQHQHNT